MDYNREKTLVAKLESFHSGRSIRSVLTYHSKTKSMNTVTFPTGDVAPLALAPFIISSPASSNNRLFAPYKYNGSYLFDNDELSIDPLKDAKGNIAIPLVIDTEFTEWHKQSLGTGRKGVTTQVKGIHKEAVGRIFAHRDMKGALSRHKEANIGFHPLCYLEASGYQVSLERVDGWQSLPKAKFILYGHFLLAEILMIAYDEYRDDILNLLAQSDNKGNKVPKLSMTRRLMATTPINDVVSSNTVEPGWVMTLEGVRYSIMLELVDTGAIHGQASYKAFCEASGIQLDAKEAFTALEKSKMDRMAIERPEDFDAYASGDLKVYDALEAYAVNMKTIYQALGLEHLYKTPKLTIGSTVKELFQASLLNTCGMTSKKEAPQFIKKYLKLASAGDLRQSSKRTSALLAKVQGGRCRSNRPLDVKVVAPLVDLDISGCYGEGQRNQLYPVGSPVIIDYDATSTCNDYMTLREFRKQCESELVPGLWHGIVSTTARLKYPQDFLASWFVNGKDGEALLAKYIKNAPEDSEDDTPFNEEDGGLKIFNYEVLNGTINHEFLQWLDNVASPRQRNELLDKLVVKAALYYPKSRRVETIEAMVKTYKDWKGVNTTAVKGKGVNSVVVRTENECHAWTAFNLGDLLIDDLLANRKLHDKKTPLNDLFKLVVNTLYGDMTSKHFTVANTTVGNNITARARALAWYMEKGLNGFQTITDGCVLELNRVVYPTKGRKVSGENLVNVYRENDVKSRNLTLKPLGGYDSITLDWMKWDELHWVKRDEDKTKDKYLIVLTLVVNGVKTWFAGKDAERWINVKTMEHLQQLFVGVDVLHGSSSSLKAVKGDDGKPVKTYIPRVGQFEFEAKKFYDQGIFHGTSNYDLSSPNGHTLKYRAYETKKPHCSVNENLFPSGVYGVKNNPATSFMKRLEVPTAVNRQPAFYKRAILKPSDYKNNTARYKQMSVTPGDSYKKPGLLREFSLSQFTFRTLEQYNIWDKWVNTAKDKYGQSVERFFLNDDHTLNFEAMVVTVDELIDKEISPSTFFSKNWNKRVTVNHPHYETYLRLKDKLANIQRD